MISILIWYIFLWIFYNLIWFDFFLKFYQLFGFILKFLPSEGFFITEGLFVIEDISESKILSERIWLLAANYYFYWAI
jgi:hypothetical protein